MLDCPLECVTFTFLASIRLACKQVCSWLRIGGGESRPLWVVLSLDKSRLSKLWGPKYIDCIPASVPCSKFLTLSLFFDSCCQVPFLRTMLWLFSVMDLCEQVSQINPLLPKLLLVMVFITLGNTHIYKWPHLLIVKNTFTFPSNELGL